MRWNPTENQTCLTTYPVDIAIEALDRVGVLKDILSRLSDNNINVRNAGVKTGRNKPAMISLRIDIRDRQQLECVINQIRNMSDILSIHRVNSLEA